MQNINFKHEEQKCRSKKQEKKELVLDLDINVFFTINRDQPSLLTSVEKLSMISQNVMVRTNAKSPLYRLIFFQNYTEFKFLN